MKFDQDAFLDKCGELYDQYKQRVGRVPPSCGCTLEGESFCFCVLCEMFDIDIIIESGLHHGSSTEMFARYFQGTGVKIYTIDTAVIAATEKMLKQYSHVKVLSGDGSILIPALLDAAENSPRIAVFIDGPKNHEQLALAKHVVNKVEFVACHDIGKDYSSWETHSSAVYDNFVTWGDYLFDTTEDWYADKYAHMNETQLRWLQGESGTSWPTRDDGYDANVHNPVLKKLTPRGFGLGIARRDPDAQ